MMASIVLKLQVALININRGRRFRAIKQVGGRRSTGATDECGMESVLAVARRFRRSARRGAAARPRYRAWRARLSTARSTTDCRTSLPTAIYDGADAVKPMELVLKLEPK